MEVHIYSVKAKSQAGHIGVKYIMTTQKAKAKRKSVRGLGPLSANPTKRSNTLKEFAGNLPTNCLTVFDHLAIFVLKGLGISFREFMHFAGNLAESLELRREHSLGYISIFENTHKKLQQLSPEGYCNFTSCFRERPSCSIVVT